MAISSEYSYNLTRDGIITEGAQLVGICPPDGSPTANQIESLGRSLNVYIKGLSLRGVLITATERYQMTLTEGTASYDYPADTVDVLPDEMFVRQVSGSTNSDTVVLNMARAEYTKINQKDATEGRPTRCMVERATSTISAVLWPVPDANSTYFISTRIRLLRDMPTGSNNMDLPSKYQQLLVLAVARSAAEKFGASLDQAQYWSARLGAEEVIALADSTERGNMILKPMPSMRAGRRN